MDEGVTGTTQISTAQAPSLQALLAPPLEPLFARPSRLGVDSAWYGHLPFARWLVTALAPTLLVELGTHAGLSYAAFCDAVLAGRLGTRCLAVDTWQGDAHAGFYDEAVFQDLERFHRGRYASFSRLLRCSFDAALASVADGSVDLLHIDGRHRYEDVQHDYESWRPKLSERAVVLFHDTAVRERDFGVWRFWAELREAHPSFEFGHAHGLGVLAPGRVVPAAIAALCRLRHADADTLRDRASLLGERWQADHDAVRLQREVNAAARREAELRAFAESTHARLADILPRHDIAEAARRALQIQLSEARVAAIAQERSHAETVREHVALRTELQHRHEAERQAGQAAVTQLRGEHAAELNAQAHRHAQTLAAGQRQHAAALHDQAAARAAEAAAAAAHRHEANLVDADLRRQLAATAAQLAAMATHAAILEQHLADLQANRVAMLGSASWRLTRPLRGALEWVPPPARRIARRLARRLARRPQPPTLAPANPTPPELLPAPANPEPRGPLVIEPLADGVAAATSPQPTDNAGQATPQAGTAPDVAAEPAPHGTAEPAPDSTAEPAPDDTAEPHQPERAAAAPLEPPPPAPPPPPELDTSTPHYWGKPTDPPLRPRGRILFASGEHDTPGHRYRIENLVQSARRLGWQADWAPSEHVNGRMIENRDVVFLWRAGWSDHIEGVFRTARELGARTVFDVDDLMFRTDLARREVIDGIRSQRFAEAAVRALFDRIACSLGQADLCTGPTLELVAEMRALGHAAMVLPNGFAPETVATARRAARIQSHHEDGLVRIGYASGSRTHQKDFAQALPALVRVLAERPDTRLTLFRDPLSGEGVVLAGEFDALAPFANRIEWRDLVPVERLPDELARFDINLAPLEPDNLFTAAKSELKYFEAALVDVPTIASPTGPFTRAIEHGVTGFLAADEAAWHTTLIALVDDPALRRRIARAAYHDALWHWGPHRTDAALLAVLGQAVGGRDGGDSFELMLRRGPRPGQGRPHVPPSRTLFSVDALNEAAVTVIMPVHNYAHYVIEALETVRRQTVRLLDLVVVDDGSTDDSAGTILDWLRRHAGRFNRVVMLQHIDNAGLGYARNTGFDAAETPYVLPLDADNRLHDQCCDRLLARAATGHAAFVYPAVQEFDDRAELIGTEMFTAAHFVRGNYVDAMALVAKWAWAAAGGYQRPAIQGWEDYDFWLRMVELGLWGDNEPTVCADYRVHAQSMLRVQTDVNRNKRALIADMEGRHPWIDMAGKRLP